MNERDFKAKLRKHLKPHVYIQSMSSLATAGTPDLWLSGKKDLWIEVKYDDKTKRCIKPKLSALQAQWLDKRHEEGRQVLVIVGISPDEAIIFENKEWHDRGFIRYSFEDTIKELLKYVL